MPSQRSRQSRPGGARRGTGRVERRPGPQRYCPDHRARGQRMGRSLLENICPNRPVSPIFEHPQPSSVVSSSRNDCRRVRTSVKWVLPAVLGAAPACRERVWAWGWRERGRGVALANAGAKPACAPILLFPTLPHPQTPSRSHASTQSSETSSRIGNRSVRR